MSQSAEIVNIANYNLKIYYNDIIKNPLLVNLMPVTLIADIKNKNYIYFDELKNDVKYNIAVMLFEENDIISINTDGDREINYAMLPFTGRTDIDLLANVSNDDLINYFMSYNITINNLFATVYKHEYEVSVFIPSVFMDLKPDSMSKLQTEIDQFIIDIFRKFISTPLGSIPFEPWYGTRIKEYLQQLSKHQVQEMIQLEVNGLAGSIKSYLITNDIANYDINTEVKLIDNGIYASIEYHIGIKINNKNYVIKIK